MRNVRTVNRRNLLKAAVAVGGFVGTDLLAQAPRGESRAATGLSYAKDNTALLIVDPYNDFMSEGGKMYKQTQETATEVGFYETCGS